MDEAAFMGDGESARDFAEEPGLLREIQMGGKAVQGKTLDQFHDDGGRIRFIEHGKNRDDGGIAESSGFAGFIQQAAAQGFIGAVTQDFYGDAAVEFFIVRRIDEAKAAFA